MGQLGAASSRPAVAGTRHCSATKVGKGQAIYATFDLFGMTDRKFLWPSDFVRQVLLSSVPAAASAGGPEARTGGVRHHLLQEEERRDRWLYTRSIERWTSSMAGLRTPTAERCMIDNAYFRVRRCRQIFPQVRRTCRFAGRSAARASRCLRSRCTAC